MMSQANGSFIPKKTPGRPVSKVSRGRVFGIFGYISYATFFGAILLSLVMFGLSYYVQNTLIDLQEQLITIQNGIEQREIQDLLVFDDYLRTIEDVFYGSFSVIPLFTAFENVVAEPVVFNSIELSRQSDQIELQVSAQAESFNATMFQRSSLSELPILSTAHIKEVQLLQDSSSPSARVAELRRDGATITQADVEQLLASAEGDETINFTFQFDLQTDNLPFSTDAYTIGNPGTSAFGVTDEPSDIDVSDDVADTDFEAGQETSPADELPDEADFFEELDQ